MHVFPTRAGRLVLRYGRNLLLSVSTLLAAHANFPAGLPVSPYITGQNYWYTAIPDSAYPIIMDSGVKIVRIGGHEPDENIFPSDAEILSRVDKIRSIGAEPLIQVSRFRSAAIAAATVQYINVTNQRAVKFWSIGNEPDIGTTGNLNETDLAAYVATYTKALSSAMRDVDPTIKIGSSDMAYYSQTKFDALLGGASDITGKDDKGRYYVDCINFHRYPFGNSFTRSGVLNEMHAVFDTTVGKVITRIGYANTLNGRSGGSALTWGLTEFNMTYSNPTDNTPAGLGVSSFLNGQFFAEYYRVGMKYGVEMMTTWSLLEGGGAGGGGDLGYVGGTWDAPIKRSSYYHMQLFADYLIPGGYLPANSSNSSLAVVSTSSPNQTMLTVMLLNESTDNQAFHLRLNDDAIVDSATKVNVSAGVARDHSGIMDSQSTAVLVFDASGDLRQRITYSLARYILNLAPLVETFTTSAAVPAMPTDFVVNSGDAKALLRWSPSAEATGYNVKRSNSSDGPYTTIASGVITTTYTDSGLTNGATYYYVLTATNAAGESEEAYEAVALPQLLQSGVAFEAENLVFTPTGSTAVINSDTGASAGKWVQLNSSSVGPYIEFTTGSVPAGTYALQLRYKSNPTRGQLSVTVDGASVGGIIDEYLSTATFPTTTVGTVTFPVTKTHTLRMTVTGKNALGTGYLLAADKFTFGGQSPVSITLGNLNQTYDGSPKSVTTVTAPVGIAVSTTYDGSTTAPTNAGAYTVISKSIDPSYVGATSSTLVIAKAPATVTLHDLQQSQDGTPKVVTATTSPAGLNVVITYNGSTTPPTDVGSYSVVGTIAEPNYQGQSSDTLTVSDTTAPVIVSLTPSLSRLTPPDHRLVPITLTAVVTDNVGATARILTATSNEADNGLGDGDTANDIQITGALTLKVRAERSGLGAGRTYTIVVEAKDAAGNATRRNTTVFVPKS